MVIALLLSWWLAERTLAGVVKDSSGGAVPGALVIVQSPAGPEQETVTGPDGRFTIENLLDGQASLVVRAAGFAEKTQAVTDAGELEVVLLPAAILESVTVTPLRREQRLGDVPASTAILDADEIKQSPAVVADDVLRQIPTFSLFRRTSSLSSHPTSQGVSLRGIGPSGVSRTLVLIDDVPFNDPFGGWVYWTRVPLDSVDRIEVVEGPSSSLYGNYGMGGVINIASAKAARRTIELKPQVGNRGTMKADVFGSDVWGKLGIAVNGSAFDTDGFPIVVASERGAVDNNAKVSFGNINAKLDYAFNPRLSAFFRVGYFSEDRDNGKISTFEPRQEEANNTRWTTTATGVRVGLPDQSTLQVRVFTDAETFRSNFLAVPPANPPRSIGRFTLNQRVPTTSVGGMAEWGRALGRRNYFSAGTDWRWVDGDSEEDGLDPIRGTTVVLHRVSGGTQRSVGAYVQDVSTVLPNLTITLSARVDHWRNYDGHNLENVPSGAPAPGNKPSLPERDDTVASPHAAAMYHLSEQVSIWGAANSAFRAPTLNELYRQFRVGSVLTLANENLGPERLVGGEAGLNLYLLRDLTVRSVWFDNHIDNPVSNVTLTATPALTTQQRQNLGATHIWGIQTDAEYRLGEMWRVSGGYQYDQAKVTEFSANPALVGKYLPQVPEHRGSVRVSYMNRRIVNLVLGAQFVGRQFDDDLNSRVVPGYTDPGLPKYAVWDLTASRAFGKNFEVFFGVQNITDREYYVGTLPTTTGLPRLVNGGVRIRFSGKS